MPESRPTLQQLIDDGAADIATALEGGDALLPENNLTVLNFVFQAAVSGLYGYLDWIAQNATPFNATGEYLSAWAGLRGVTQTPATAASGSFAFPTAGPNIPEGTQLVRGDNETYLTTAEGVIAGGVVTVQATDMATGAQGNCPEGTVVTLGTMIGGVTSAGAASTPITGGNNIQGQGSFRTNMLQAYAQAPQGGDLADYVTWALEVAGVTRAWNAGVIAGAGTVTVYFMMDVSEAAFGGFPQGADGVAANETRAGAPAAATGDQLAVANHIFPLRPVTALVICSAPLANDLDLTIAGTAAWSAATKTAVEAAISQALLENAAPGGVTDAQGNPIGVVDLSAINSGIAAVAGTAGFVITAMSCANGTITPGGVGNVSSNAGYLAVLSTVTFDA